MYTIKDFKKIILLGLVFISVQNRGVLSASPCVYSQYEPEAGNV
jgi:hypothetical protein